MPSSVSEGSRPSACTMRSYSSGAMPCVFSSSGVARHGRGAVGSDSVAILGGHLHFLTFEYENHFTRHAVHGEEGTHNWGELSRMTMLRNDYVARLPHGRFFPVSVSNGFRARSK